KVVRALCASSIHSVSNSDSIVGKRCPGEQGNEVIKAASDGGKFRNLMIGDNTPHVGVVRLDSYPAPAKDLQALLYSANLQSNVSAYRKGYRNLDLNRCRCKSAPFCSHFEFARWHQLEAVFAL